MKMLKTIIVCLGLSIAGSAMGQVVVESLDGPVTQKEIQSFVDYYKTAEVAKDNTHNGMAYGSAGEAAESLNDIYEISQNREILDELIGIADKMLAARNDPETGRVMFTGKRELVWPNSPDPETGPENGDVMAHIAAAALNILKTKSLWNEKYSDGKTYLEKAKTLIAECDKSNDTFMIPNYVEKDTNKLLSPAAPDHKGVVARHNVPWNQQAMIIGDFLRLAICHDMLGDDPQRVAQYDAIVKTSALWQLDDVTKYQINNVDCYKWSYVSEDKTLRHVEDAAHGGYDLYIYRIYASGRYGITKDQVMPYANEVALAMTKPDGMFAQRVDGSVNEKSPAKKTLGATYMYMAALRPDLYEPLAKSMLPDIKAKPQMAARILWVKYYRNLGRFPAQDANKEK